MSRTKRVTRGFAALAFALCWRELRARPRGDPLEDVPRPDGYDGRGHGTPFAGNERPYDL
jgi:hypothetical protein